MTPVALTIAGSDPSGGAGIQADLKTFHQHGVYGMSVITLLTVQNTQTVATVETLPPELVLAQLDTVLADILPKAAKTGALGNAEIIRALASRAREFAFPLVVDPVLVSKHGLPLIERDAVESIKKELLPHAFLVTPNHEEAAVLSGLAVTDEASMREAARAISRLGCQNVLVKGGHLEHHAVDILFADGECHRLASNRIETPNTHGTGCVYSAAITARLARGEDLLASVWRAKQFVTEAIRTNPRLGHGFGPVNMHTPVA